VDVIKIDKSFIDQLSPTSGGEAMVRAVVELVHTLGLVAGVRSEGAGTPGNGALARCRFRGHPSTLKG
jgi:EAL domain-containing protein (putative c-di-GMP-specific phosphodiesterase class I)